MAEQLNFEKVYRSYQKMYASERAEECRREIRHLYSLVGTQGFPLSKEQVEDLIVCTTELFLRADRQISQGEKELLDFVYAETRLYDRVLAAMNDDIVPLEEAWDKLIDGLPESAKNAIVSIAACLIAADEEINLREKLLFEKIYL